MAATPVCSIDFSGIHYPAYSDCLAYVQGVFQGIYGQDIVLTADTQDGELCAILAKALSDTNAATVSVYNAFSPSTAQGAGLSSVVKINGLARKVPTTSSVDIVCVGQAGAKIVNGSVSDGANGWYLPPLVVIPAAGQVTVTATAASAGAISLSPYGIDTANGVGSIVTPTFGWQAAYNPFAATVGAPVESDAQLRIRQSQSTMLAAVGVGQALIGAILDLPGVQAVTLYENDTNALDANGIPGHCIALVVTGGDDTAIANVISTQKGQGVGTYGTTIISVTNSFGISRNVAFFRPTPVSISYTVTLRALRGYTVDVAAGIQGALAAATTARGVGQSIIWSRMLCAANSVSATAYEVLGLTQGRPGTAQAAFDVPIAFNETAAGDPSLVTLTVVP